MHHEVTVAVAASQATVWGVLADLETWPSWTASMRDVEPLGPFVVGTTVRIRQPRLPVVSWSITELDPGHSFTWRSTAAGSRSVASHAVRATGSSSSEVTLAIDQTGTLGSIVGFLLRGLTRRYVQMEADGLAAEAVRRG